MRPSQIVTWLSWLIAVPAAVAAVAGLVWTGGEAPSTFATLRGQTVDLYGTGLYRYDTRFTGAANKGSDAVTLVLAVPLLLYAALRYRSGSLRGGFLLLGALGWFLYVYAGYALGATAYNELFLLYTLPVSASLFAFIVLLGSFELRALSDLPARLPRLGPAIFMVASGAATLGIWIIAPVSALLSGGTPAGLDSYTTLFTTALDLSVIVPATVTAGVLSLRRNVLGYLVAFLLLVLEAFLLPLIVTQTVSQVSAGVRFTLPQIVGPVSGFIVLALFSIWVMGAIYRNLPTVYPSAKGGHGAE